jgi:hypothetical protein
LFLVFASFLPACNHPSATTSSQPISDGATKKVDTSGPEFEEWVKSFVAELRSGDKARMRKAAIAFMPTPDEIQQVFPRSGPHAAKQMGAWWRKTTDAEIDRASEELVREFARPGAIEITDYRDLRKEPKDDARVTKALEEMQPDVPFVEAGWLTGNVGCGRAYYMRVNGRWVFLDSLKGIVEVD